MIVKIYDARQSTYKAERPKAGKREFIVDVKDISVNVEKLFIDGEEVSIGEKDLILVDASSIHFIAEDFDKERGITVYKEARLTTKENSIKEAIKNALDDAQYLVTWVVRHPE
jgi:hypothetical protein